MRVVIAGGGTGGHIYPALAMADEFKSRGLQVTFVGAYRGLESQIVPKHGYSLIRLPVGQLNVPGLAKLKTLLLLPIALLLSLYHLILIRPQLVIGVGGYAAGPFVFVASFFTKAALWEPNSYPGMTNRLLAPYVNKCYLVFEQTHRLLKNQNWMRVGLPVRSQIDQFEPLGESHDDFHVFIFGGSQGSRAINHLIADMLEQHADQMEGVRFYHQVGRTEHSAMRERYGNQFANLEYVEYVDDMAGRYRWSDLVICRGGTGTVAELAATATPAIIIPLPSAADNHQQKNAELLVKAGAAKMLLQGEISADDLWREINDLRHQRLALKEMGQAMRGFHVPKSSAVIVDDMLKLCEG